MPKLHQAYEKVRERSKRVLDDGRWAFFELYETLRNVADTYEREENEGMHKFESLDTD